MLEEYIALDLEMTGLSMKTDRILELGAVRVQNGIVAESFSAVVNPKTVLSEEIIRLTGITQDEAAAGRDPDEAVEAFLGFLGDEVLVGQNLRFDFGFLQQWAANHNRRLTKHAVDTLKLARKFLPADQKKDLDSLCGYYGIVREHSHRAYYDAADTAQILECLKREFGEREPEAFLPVLLDCRVKKQSPMTEHQRQYLKRYVQHYQIPMPDLPEGMTKSEASRLTDRLIAQYGKLPNG